MKVLQSIEGKMFREGVCVLICLHALWKCVEARELLLRITHQLLGCREAADTAQEWLAHPNQKSLAMVSICFPLYVYLLFVAFGFSGQVFLCSLLDLTLWTKLVLKSQQSVCSASQVTELKACATPALCVFFIGPFTAVICVSFSVSLSHGHSLTYHFSQVYCHNW